MINFTIMLCNDCEVVHSTNTCWLFGLHRGLSSSFPNSDGISWPFRDLILCFVFFSPFLNVMVGLNWNLTWILWFLVLFSTIGLFYLLPPPPTSIGMGALRVPMVCSSVTVWYEVIMHACVIWAPSSQEMYLLSIQTFGGPWNRDNLTCYICGPFLSVLSLADAPGSLSNETLLQILHFP